MTLQRQFPRASRAATTQCRDTCWGGRRLAARGLVRRYKVILARSQIGMVVRAGAAKPDIGSVDALRRSAAALRAYWTAAAAKLYRPRCLMRHRERGAGSAGVRGLRPASRRPPSRARRGGRLQEVAERYQVPSWHDSMRSAADFRRCSPLQPGSLKPRARSASRTASAWRPRVDATQGDSSHNWIVQFRRVGSLDGRCSSAANLRSV